MRETEIRMRNKMHGYARACLDSISRELKQEFKDLFIQFDELKIVEHDLKN